MPALSLKPAAECRFDLVSLGEVMLRLDPGQTRIHTARQFKAWEGGGEYNVARGLKRCFGLRTAVVTALVDNPIGRLLEDLILQGGVDSAHVRWVPDDGVGRTARNGLNFTERGFGVRAALGCSDRGHTAVSQLEPGDVDWERLFASEGARWFHTGGIFAALSETAPLVAREAMTAARKHGTLVSYDLNYRPSLWTSIGGKARAREVNRELAPLVDIVEVFNARVHPGRLNAPAEDLVVRHGKLRGAGSDAHTVFELGGASVTLPTHENEPAAFLEAMASAVVEGTTSSNLVHLASTWAKVRKKLPGARRY